MLCSHKKLCAQYVEHQNWRQQGPDLRANRVKLQNPTPFPSPGNIAHLEVSVSREASGLNSSTLGELSRDFCQQGMFPHIRQGQCRMTVTTAVN